MKPNLASGNVCPIRRWNTPGLFHLGRFPRQGNANPIWPVVARLPRRDFQQMLHSLNSMEASGEHPSGSDAWQHANAISSSVAPTMILLAFAMVGFASNR
jgi:hypothetical protein